MRQDLIAGRKRLGWTQVELGQKVGLPQPHISGIESGKVVPRFNTLLDLVRVLEYDLLLVPRTLVPAALALIHHHSQAADGERPMYAVDPSENSDES
ncbi:MAG: helix-turn-helix transcriptional regulator [Bryobacteraceae bacterium]